LDKTALLKHKKRQPQNKKHLAALFYTQRAQRVVREKRGICFLSRENVRQLYS